MPIPLQYEISAIGANRLKRVIRGIEREAQASVKRLDAATARQQKFTRQQKSSAMRGFAEIGKVAQREEMKRHRQAMRLREREERRAISGMAKIGAVARRENDRAHRSEMRNIERQKRARMATVRRVGRGAAGTVGGMARGAAGLAGVTGGLLVGNAVRERVGASALATGIANRAALVPGERRSRSQLREQVFGQTRALEEESGRSQRVFLEGFDKFLEKTGAFDAGTKLFKNLSVLADAAGVTDEAFSDVSRAMGIMFAGFQKQGMGTVEAMAATETAFQDLVKQSAAGQIGIPDLAQELPKIIAAASRFGGNQADAVSSITALSNIAVATAAKGPEEATTAAVRFTDDLISKSGKLKKKFGVDVFDQGGNIRDARKLIPEIMTATGGDLTKLTDIFGKRGIRLVEGFGKITREADSPEAARKEIERQIATFTGGEVTPDQLQKGAKAVRESEARRIARSFQKLNRVLADEFVPVVTKAAPELAKLVPEVARAAGAIADFANFMIDNPLQGIGAIVAAKVTADIAAASIGEAVSNVLTKRVAAGAAGNAAAGGAVGPVTATSGRAPSKIGRAVVAIGAATIMVSALEFLGEQAGALAEESGMNKERLKPGMTKKGKFSAAQLAGDVLNPISFVQSRGAELVKGALNFDKNLDEQAKARAVQEGRITPEESGLSPERLIALMSESSDAVTKKQLEAAEKQIAAADSMMAASQHQNNRRNSPLARR